MEIRQVYYVLEVARQKSFSKAATEVLEILNYVEDEEFNKIDKTFINMLEKCKDENHEFKINENDDFDSLVLTQKTNDLLAYIYRKYWANEEEKIEFDELLMKKDDDNNSESINEYNKLIEYDENIKEKTSTSIFKRLFVWIKNKISNK